LINTRRNTKIYAQYYDKNRKQIEYTKGEKVRVHFPIAENKDLRYKLGVRWREKIDNVTFRVKKEEYNRIE
jgi:hypothetical protein